LIGGGAGALKLFAARTLGWAHPLMRAAHANAGIEWRRFMMGSFTKPIMLHERANTMFDMMIDLRVERLY
jgi:hypothetical protein